MIYCILVILHHIGNFTMITLSNGFCAVNELTFNFVRLGNHYMFY